MYKDGNVTLQLFNRHLEKLGTNNIWVLSIDLYMTAVALEVDLVSINDFDDSVITALMDPYLFRAVPALIQRLHARMLATVFIGNLHIVLNSGMHPNHFIYLIPIV